MVVWGHAVVHVQMIVIFLVLAHVKGCVQIAAIQVAVIAVLAVVNIHVDFLVQVVVVIKNDK